MKLRSQTPGDRTRLARPLRIARARNSLAGLVMASAALVAPPLNADVIIGGPNVIGTVALQDETYGSGSVSVSPFGLSSVSAPLVNGAFSIRIEPGVQFHLNATLSSLQNTANARLTVQRPNQPALGVDEVRNYALSYTTGRIRASVQTPGAELLSVSLQTSGSGTGESYSGSVSGTAAQMPLEQPFVAGSNRVAYGTVTVRVDGTCNVARSLPARTIAVGAGTVTDVTWTEDFSQVDCATATGSITGTIGISGLSDASPPAALTYQRVYASGPGFKDTYLTTLNGSYSLVGLPTGTYSVYHSAYFAQPYTWADFGRLTNVQVSAGAETAANLAASVGTVEGAIETVGLWDLTDTNSTVSYWQSTTTSGQQGYDVVDRNTGLYNLVVPAGNHRIYQHQFSFYDPAAEGNVSSSISRRPSTVLAPPFTVGQGQHEIASPIVMQTSESLVAVQLQDPSLKIKALSLSGIARVFDPDTNAFLEQIQLNLSTTRSAPSNSVTPLVRGFPGRYNMTAIVSTDTGSTLSKPFELILGAPFNTLPGTNVEQPISLPGEDTSIGTITFGSVEAGGETTVSFLSSGPEPASNFRLVVPTGNSGQGDLAYYDIRTTAEFDVATVCLSYDDAEFNGNDNKEAKLQMHHYQCADPIGNTGCDWENITLTPDYPDIQSNRICGKTDSFSIFALALPRDDDDDGIDNVDDNCPATANSSQSDLDTDGIGDACDSDVDGDGLTDDQDLCPFTATSDNTDSDGDGLGDPCDADLDGDTVDNLSDNCPLNGNSDQSDFDSDGAGDACDLDDDNDSLDDSSDLCPGSQAGVLIDADGCSSQQRVERSCPLGSDYKNHGQYVSCVAKEATTQVALGLIDDSEKDAIVSAAAQVGTGKPK